MAQIFSKIPLKQEKSTTSLILSSIPNALAQISPYLPSFMTPDLLLIIRNTLAKLTKIPSLANCGLLPTNTLEYIAVNLLNSMLSQITKKDIELSSQSQNPLLTGETQEATLADGISIPKNELKKQIVQIVSQQMNVQGQKFEHSRPLLSLLDKLTTIMNWRDPEIIVDIEQSLNYFLTDSRTLNLTHSQIFYNSVLTINKEPIRVRKLMEEEGVQYYLDYFARLVQQN